MGGRYELVYSGQANSYSPRPIIEVQPPNHLRELTGLVDVSLETQRHCDNGLIWRVDFSNSYLINGGDFIFIEVSNFGLPKLIGEGLNYQLVSIGLGRSLSLIGLGESAACSRGEL